MSLIPNPIVETYSRLAGEYDDDSNIKSCWGRASEKAMASVRIRDTYQVILDVGCGTGRGISSLASVAKPGVCFIGIDPAENMCKIARQRTSADPCIHIYQGSFEKIPLESKSVDYLYSVFAFHWVSDLAVAVAELSRVLKPNAEMDLFFIGRNNGREFIQKTSPIFLKHMGPALLLDSARLRKQLTKDAVLQLFSDRFDPRCLSVKESYDTYYDNLKGHWAWWVRIEGHFVKIPPQRKKECDAEVRMALESLAGPQGIPYTIHEIHVNLRCP